jgi:hypothetical protein
MVERKLLDSGGSVTQSVAAVVELLSCLGRPKDPLPEIVDLGTVKLARSNKGDVFYCVTAALPVVAQARIIGQASASTRENIFLIPRRLRQRSRQDPTLRLSDCTKQSGLAGSMGQ